MMTVRLEFGTEQCHTPQRLLREERQRNSGLEAAVRNWKNLVLTSQDTVSLE